MSGKSDEKFGEQRQCARKRSMLAGKLVYGDGYFTVNCVIRDLSDRGARLKIPDGQVLPANIYFLELKSGGAYEARVAWRRHPEIGLEFTRQCQIDDPNDKVMVILRRIWAEARVRTGPIA